MRDGDKVRPAYFLVGEDAYLKEKAREEIRASIMGGASGEFDIKVFYGDESGARDIIDYARTSPFLSSKRLAIVKDFGSMSKDDKRAVFAYIKNPYPTSCLILECDDAYAIEADKDLMKNASVRSVSKPKQGDVAAWARKSIAARGKSISQDAMEMLGDADGENLLSMSSELEKLILFVGDRKEINRSDVEAVMGYPLSRSTFEMLSYIEARGADRAVGVIRDQISRGKRPHELVGLISWHLKRLLEAKALEEGGRSDYEIVYSLKIRRDSQKDFLRQLKALTSEKIRSALEILLEADLKIKNSVLDPVLTLESAVLRLCLL